jgi:hypothetical protein
MNQGETLWSSDAVRKSVGTLTMLTAEIPTSFSMILLSKTRRITFPSLWLNCTSWSKIGFASA